MRDDASSSAQEGSLRFRGAMHQRGERGVDGLGASRSEEDVLTGISCACRTRRQRQSDAGTVQCLRTPSDQPGQRADAPEEHVREGIDAEEVPVPPLLVYIAPKSGKRYHVRSMCHGLLTASGVRSEIVCRDCLDGGIGVQPLFGYPGGLRHVSRAHAEATALNMWTRIDEFKRCMKCRD